MYRLSRRTAYVLLFLGVLALCVAVTGAVAVTRKHSHAGPAPAPVLSAVTATWEPSVPALPDDVHVAWAYLDSTEGDVQTSGDLDLHPLDQLVVPGLAEDRLNTLQQHEASAAAADITVVSDALAGDQGAAARLTDTEGGLAAGMGRVIDACQLADTHAAPPAATVLDAARYGACLREGAIVDPDNAAWVLDRMREIRGGIGDARGRDSDGLAQFNSTVTTGDRTRAACLGVGAYWSAAVFVDWPGDRGSTYGVAVCAEVAQASFPPDTQQAPDSPAPAGSVINCPYGLCRGTD